MQTLATRIDGPVAVIGDVHGQAEKLLRVLEKLREMAGFERRWLVFIGDYLDRGPDSKSVMEIVTDLLVEHPCTTAIAGNHEFALSAALGLIPTPEYSDWSEQWVANYDTLQTFESYEARFGDLRQLSEQMPLRHKEFLANLPWCVEHPQFLFVHAGLNASAPFDMQLRILQQKDFSLSYPQWLCEKFPVETAPPPDCPLTVVSGHVHVPQVEFRRKRILIDTCGQDGDLSCVLLPERIVVTSAADAVVAQSRSWWKMLTG